MNKTQIAKALREAVFAPSKQGPLKVIADVGNLDYYIRRAMESLLLSLTALTADQRIAYLNTALSLIALAKVTVQDVTFTTMRSREEVFGEVDKQLSHEDHAKLVADGAKDEVDKQNQGGEVQGTGDSIQKECVPGNILDIEGRYKGPGQVPQAVQPRAEAPEEKHPFHRGIDRFSSKSED